ncbi:MAG: phenylalanine--tRNA ligase subunit beta [Rhodoferax sp.]
MQFPESWLRTFCNPPLDTQQLADTLTMAGLEVEALDPVAPAFTRVVVGAIRHAEQHPNADRLRVCLVDVGQDQPLRIVCGAPNARAGIKVPCALVGARLPPGSDGKAIEIKVGKLRGVESHGMLCSARELGLSQDHGGLLELAADAPVGQDVRKHLGLDDTLFTLKLTPNLAHCLSVFGVARELSALTGAPLTHPKFTAAAVQIPDVLPVHIDAPDLCGRFSGRIIRNVNPKAPTPQWMIDRLARCGQRSVNALVDISNYVMFELGRPSHIFDLERIQQGLVVRWARPGETLKLLNGNTVTLDARVGVIADANQVESLAGIMGGDATAVGDDTRNIYIEAAFWHPNAIAGRARRFNFSTEAAHRFERGVDPELTVEHIERITELVVTICGTAQTQCGPIDDHRVSVPTPPRVRLRVARASKVLGMPLTQAQCAQALRGLGLSVTEGDGIIDVIPQSFRFDLQIEEDLIEEVARVVGFDKLPLTPPQAPITAKLRPESQRNAFALRRSLAALGYQETINFSFVDARWEADFAGQDQPIRLLNPIASHMSVMRSTLLGSLVQVLKFNQDRKAQRVRVFEIGRVFLRDERVQDSDTSVRGFDQPQRVAALACGPVDELSWCGAQRAVDFYDIKGDLEALFAPQTLRLEPAPHPALHPGRSARVWLDDQDIGFMGELHPKWCQRYELVGPPVVFEIDLDALLQRRVPVSRPISRQQAVERDLAIWVPAGCTHEALMAAVWRAPTDDLLRNAVVFDVYRPAAGAESDEKSMAIRLTLCSDDAPLTDAQIEAAVASIRQTLIQRLGARLRA